MATFDETSHHLELLLAVDRAAPRSLCAQIEDHLRCAIRDATLRAGTQLPSTRNLARQLGVSRQIIVAAYAQLAAEGYLALRQGARPRVSHAPVAARAQALPARPAPRPRFDFRPSVPDVTAFPRASYLRSLREAVAHITDADLGQGDPRGAPLLQAALAEYLGRVRGVVADPSHIVVTCGFAQGLGLVCQALAATGARRIAMEDPGNLEDRRIAARAGLEPVPIRVDDDGLRVDELARAAPDAVVVTPAHQHPLGAVLGRARRTALLDWLRAHPAIAIEDDYDAEYRYDRVAVGALQGLAPDRIVYAGTTSKTLAPALRLGWLVVPPSLIEGVAQAKLLADRGNAVIEQLAFADFLARGELDRHLRRMRVRYRKQRDAVVQALADELPEATVTGIAAGLHATIRLPPTYDEPAIRAELVQRGIQLSTLSDYTSTCCDEAPMLMLGYAHLPEPAILAGVRALAAAVRATLAARHSVDRSTR